ncbi:cdc42-interacting protein 4 homolog [Rhopilema esculentum]|uniref:cdc42-interacting protein 4 homolog n=1 Tax=Rhopilema esculentum TaxID=499914 RepID=UPI0031D499CD
MSWGRELWDKRDQVEKHTQQGIEFLEKCASFVKARAKIEQDYAKDLRKLVKQFQFKKKEEDDLQFTYQIALKKLLAEVDDYAGQRERISESLQDNLFKDMHHLINESKSEKRKHLHELSDLKSNLESTNRQMQNARKEYEKANQESDLAIKQYETASSSMDLTKAQIIKFQNISKEKGQVSEKAKGDYLAALENFNKTQTLFYESDLPRVLDEKMEAAEEDRIEKLKGYFKAFTEAHRVIIPIVHRCLEGMDAAADTCDAKKDSLSLIDMHKTGNQRPGNILFEDNGKPNLAVPAARSPKASRSKKGLFRSREKAKALNQEDYADDFSDLPPEQRRKKFHKKIRELEDQVNQQTKSRDALVKMSETVAQFGGDMQTIQSQLDANAKEIDKFNHLLHQYRCYLAVIEETAPPTMPSKMSGSSSMQSLSSNVSNDHVPAAPPPPQNNASMPPVGAPTVEVTGPPVPPPPPLTDEFDEPKCTVLYDFEGRSDGEFTVSAGEELVIVDDDGSGWTLVARGSEEGYVPTSYVEKL